MGDEYRYGFQVLIVFFPVFTLISIQRDLQAADSYALSTALVAVLGSSHSVAQYHISALVFRLLEIVAFAV